MQSPISLFPQRAQIGIKLALVQWKDRFFLHIQNDNAKLTNALLRLIAQQRNGEVIEQTLVKKVVESLVSLGLDSADPKKKSLDVYKEHIEAPFITATEEYYKKESDTFLSQHTVSDYLKKVEVHLTDEEDRVERYLHTETRDDLVRKCEHVLIRGHTNLMWDSLQTLLDFDKNEDLQRMYALLSRIPEGLELLRRRFEGHVRRAGLNAISRLVDEMGANTDFLDPKAYVDALLEVHRKNSEAVARSFKGEARFAASLDKACREFVNRNAATGASSRRSPELIAKHSDLILRKSNKMAEDDIKSALNHLVWLILTLTLTRGIQSTLLADDLV